MRRPQLTPSTLWKIFVPVACALAGLLFATSAQTARGTDLRSPQAANLAALVRSAEGQVSELTQQLAGHQSTVDGLTATAGRQNSAVAQAQSLADPLRAPFGLSAVSGPGIRVVLDDADQMPAGAVDPNQLVVHQSDLQAVVNSLWAGGAEAMAVAGQRIVPTSAIRCVGNTLLLNGRVFSPPFEVAAVGPFGTMRSAMDRSPGVGLFRQAANYYGLGFTVEPVAALNLAAFGGSISVNYAKAVPQ